MPNTRKQTITAANDAITLSLKGRIVQASAATGPNSPATADFVMEASYNDGDDWITPIQMTDPTTPGGYVASLTGASKSGWANLGGADKVRMRRTDANVGNGDISLTVVSKPVGS